MGTPLDLAVTHLNAPYGPVLEEAHLRQALCSGTLAELPSGPAAIASSLFLEVDPQIIVGCAQAAGAPLRNVQKLYEETTRSNPRSPDWETSVAHLL